ncbi:MAG: carboxymuconolactone decarboxylase family protein [Planctomycetota bacterium]
MSDAAPVAAPPLDDLVRLCAAVCLHDRERLAELAAGLAPHARAPRLRETLLQCHLFCGFPRTIAALDALSAHGLHIAGEEDPDPADPGARGAPLFDAIYGAGADGVREHLAGLDPTFARWVAEHAYGRVLSRTGLSGAERELLAVAALAATGHERQLASHARGAVRLGAAPGDVAGVLDAIAGSIDHERLVRARSVVERFARPDPRR